MSPETLAEKPETIKSLLNDDENYEFKFKKVLEPDIQLDATPIKSLPKSIDLGDVKSDMVLDDKTDNTAEKRQKLNDGKVKKRIRKLTLSTEDLKHVGVGRKNNTDTISKSGRAIKVVFTLLPVLIIGAVICSDRIRNELFANYERNLNFLVYGKLDYCDQKFTYDNITHNLKLKLIGQTQSIDQIAKVFRNHELFTSLALMGNTGVGKTYTTSLIEESFSWHENIQFYIWSDESHHKQVEHIQQLTFSKCGHNILFIDDLSYEDRNFVLQINEILKTKSFESNLKLIVVYVINLNKHVAMSRDAIASHANTLKLIKDLNIIEYRDLNADDILGCINLLAKSLSISLTDPQKLNILRSVTESQSGCKNVLAKMFLYANEN